jgi:hypothetical protein
MLGHEFYRVARARVALRQEEHGPQRLEIIVAKELQCLREILRQRNLGSISNLGSIRWANTRRRMIFLRHRLACACWPG